MIIKEIIQKQGFQVNENKGKMVLLPTDEKIVMGLIVTKDRITTTPEFKKSILELLFLDKTDKILRGKISFLSYINPEDELLLNKDCETVDKK